jgi:hypothetical protein
MSVYGCTKCCCGTHTLGTRVAMVSERRRAAMASAPGQSSRSTTCQGWRRYRPNLWPSTVVEVATPAAASVDASIRHPDADVAGGVRGLTGGRGVDEVYDAVGGLTTSPALGSLAHRGQLVVIIAIGSRTAQVNLIDLYHNEIRILDPSAAFSTWWITRRLNRDLAALATTSRQRLACGTAARGRMKAAGIADADWVTPDYSASDR